MSGVDEQGQPDREWLRTPEGREWLRTDKGTEWIGSDPGQEWMRSDDARIWLDELVQDGFDFSRDAASVEMFDDVRVRSTLETERLGYAGRAGLVHGVTVPSETGVGPVIGEVGAGVAIHVHFDDLNEGAWFAPDLIEPVDGGPRTVSWMTVGGVTYVRDAEGQWAPADDENVSSSRPAARLAQRLRRIISRGK